MSEIPLWPSRSTATPRSRRADALANEQLILASAQKLFEEEGVEEATMSAIAKDAGIGKGTLYRAFANKGELCLALMDGDLQSFQERTLALLAEQSETLPLAQLAAFLENLVRFLAGHAALLCEAENHGVLRDRPEIDQTSLHEWFRTTVFLMLRRAEAAGEIDSDVDLDYLADAVLAPLNPRLIRYQLSEQGLPVEALSHSLVRFVLGGARA